MFRIIHAAALAAGLALAGCAASDAAEHEAVPSALADRIAIEDMVIEYYTHLGGGDAGAFDEYFTEDAVFDVNGIVATGREEIEAIYADIGEDEENVADEGTFHMILSNPVIEIDGDTATARFIWTGVLNTAIGDPPVIREQGREYDKLERQEDGSWLFTHRVVIADSGLPDRMGDSWEPRLDYDIAAD